MLGVTVRKHSFRKLAYPSLAYKKKAIKLHDFGFGMGLAVRNDDLPTLITRLTEEIDRFTRSAIFSVTKYSLWSVRMMERS